jgi:hypothetical protein
MPKGAELIVESIDASPTEQRTIVTSLEADSPSVEVRPEPSKDLEALLENMLAIPEPDFRNPGGKYPGWDFPTFDFADLVNPQTNDQNMSYPSLELSPVVHNSTTAVDQTMQLLGGIPSPNTLMPAPSIYMVRSLIQRPKVNIGAQRTASLMFHALKSFPRMMLRHDTFPPFIHPHLISFDFEDNDMELITNCISLMHMISGRAPGSRKLFWKYVRLECERICHEVP